MKEEYSDWAVPSSEESWSSPLSRYLFPLDYSENSFEYSTVFQSRLKLSNIKKNGGKGFGKGTLKRDQYGNDIKVII